MAVNRDDFVRALYDQGLEVGHDFESGFALWLNVDGEDPHLHSLHRTEEDAIRSHRALVALDEVSENDFDIALSVVVDGLIVSRNDFEVTTLEQLNERVQKARLACVPLPEPFL
jgi:hypothetical protein